MDMTESSIEKSGNRSADGLVGIYKKGDTASFDAVKKTVTLIQQHGKRANLLPVLLLGFQQGGKTSKPHSIKELLTSGMNITHREISGDDASSIRAAFAVFCEHLKTATPTQDKENGGGLNRRDSGASFSCDPSDPLRSEKEPHTRIIRLHRSIRITQEQHRRSQKEGRWSFDQLNRFRRQLESEEGLPQEKIGWCPHSGQEPKDKFRAVGQSHEGRYEESLRDASRSRRHVV